MQIVKNLLSNPEQSENPLPPMMPGEMITQSKLNALRRSQLVNLAMAFNIQVDPDAPKSELLHFMIRAEQTGKFRTKPSSMYYMLLATNDPDVRRPRHEQDAFENALAQAAEDEGIIRQAAKQAYPPDGRSLQDLQAEAQALGINVMAKSAAQLRRLIAEAKPSAA